MSSPALSPEQAETERRVFKAAKQLERASQYGIPANAALEEFERARTEQAVMRLLVAS